MSHSPGEATENEHQLKRYRQGWGALNRLLHEQKSFSGREANTAFLNTGETRFANASFALGWGFLDDARAIATIDWDHDGDLDVWVTNRTAPRLRLLRNNLESSNQTISIKLEGNGTTTNRDAIGTRVTVNLKDQPPVMRSLHAGQSFLSQSSRLLHFGLGKKPVITGITVVWPGGEIQNLPPVETGTTYSLKQGQTLQKINRSLLTTPRLREKSVSSTDSSIRVVSPPGLPFPEIQHPLPSDTPSLVIIWTPTCPHCLKELRNLATTKELPKPLNLLALSLEGADSDIAKELSPHITFKTITSDYLLTLEAFQQAQLDLWPPLEVPSSFLISPERELLAMYKGDISPRQITSDNSLSSKTSEERRKIAQPFPGIWIGDPSAGDPELLVNQLLDRKQPLQAISYLQKVSQHPTFSSLSEKERGDTFFNTGRLLGKNGAPDQAITPLEKAGKLLPTDQRVMRLLAQAYTDTEQHPRAIDQLKNALTLYPNSLPVLQQLSQAYLSAEMPTAVIKTLEKLLAAHPREFNSRYLMAQTLASQGKTKQAIAHYKQVLGHNPRFLMAACQLSLILSTHPLDTERAPEEAFQLAQRLCQMTRRRNSAYLHALACALANLGKFPEATDTLNEALKLTPETSPSRSRFQTDLQTIGQKLPVRNQVLAGP